MSERFTNIEVSRISVNLEECLSCRNKFDSGDMYKINFTKGYKYGGAFYELPILLCHDCFMLLYDTMSRVIDGKK